MKCLIKAKEVITDFLSGRLVFINYQALSIIINSFFTKCRVYLFISLKVKKLSTHNSEFHAIMRSSDPSNIF